MSNYILSATLELKDRFSAKIDNARKSTYSLRQAMQETGGAADGAAANLGRIGAAAQSAGVKAEQAKRSFQGIKGTYAATIQARDNASGTLRKIRADLTGLTGKAHNIFVNVRQNGTLNNLKDKAGGVASGMMLGTGAQMAAGAGIGFGIYDAVKGYMDFEQEMSNVRALMNPTDKEFQELTDKAVQMGADTKFSATESAEALQYMGMAGWSAQESMDALEGVMDLTAASGEKNLGTVSDIVTDTMTSFHKSGAEAQEFADVLAAAATSSNTNVTKMGYTFKYAAPLAGALGYTIQDVALAIGAMADSGIKGEQAGTGLRAILTRLSDPTSDASGTLNQLGISMSDAAGNMRPLRSVLSDLRTKFKELTPVEKSQIATALAGQEAQGAFLAMMDESDDKWDKLAYNIDNATGAAKKMAAIRMDNLAGDIEYLSGDWDAFTMKLMKGTPAKGLRDFVQEADKLLSHFSAQVDLHGLGVRSIFSLVGEGIKDLKDKFLAFDGIGSILAGGALAAGLYKIAKLGLKAKDALQDLTSVKVPSTSLPGAGRGLSGVKDMVVSAQNVIINGKSQTPAGIPQTTPTTTPGKTTPVPTGKPTPGGTKVGGRLGSIKNFFSGGLKGIGALGLLAMVANGALDVAYAPEGERGRALAGAGGGIAGGIAGAKGGAALGATIGSVVPGVGTAAGGAAGGIIGGVAGGVLGSEMGSSFTKTVYDAVNGFDWEGLKQTIAAKNGDWSQTFSDWKYAWDNTLQWFGEGYENKIQELNGLTPDFSNIGYSAEQTWQWVQDSAGSAWDNITQTIAAKNDEWSQSFASAKDNAAQRMDELQAWCGTKWDEIGAGAESLQGRIGNAFANARNAAQSAWDGVTGWFEANVWGPLSARAESAWSSIKGTMANIRAEASSFSFHLPSFSFGGNATGSAFYPGGWTEINERGGEIVDLPQGSRIYPHATTERMIQKELREGSSSGPAPVVIQGNTFYVREEADIDRIADKLARLIQASALNYGGVY